MKMRFESADEMREKVPVGTKFKAYRGGLKVWSSDKQEYVPIEDPHPRRAVLEDDQHVFVYNPRAKRYGMRLDIEYFVISYIADVTPAGNESVAWERRVRNVIKKLDASGLWLNIRRTFEEILEMGYERRKRLHDLFWDDSWEEYKLLNGTRNNPERAAVYNRAFESHYGELMNEIPFAFHKGDADDSVWNVNTDLIFEMSDAKTKSMYFGKYWNAQIKAEIGTAIAEKRKCSKRARTSYDVSFEYDPEKNRAWYSEEYKDCGNGHYYLAIDANTALFYEDD